MIKSVAVLTLLALLMVALWRFPSALSSRVTVSTDREASDGQSEALVVAALPKNKGDSFAVANESSRNSSFRALDAVLQERIREAWQNRDLSVLPDPHGVMDLVLICASINGVRNEVSAGRAISQSDRALLQAVGDRCVLSASELSVESDWLWGVAELQRSADPVSEQARLLAMSGYVQDDQLKRFGPTERSRLVEELLLKAVAEENIELLLQALSVERDPQTRFELIENLPGMGNMHDYRSMRFLHLIGQLVVCGEFLNCGPNSIRAFRLCYPRGICRSGISVRDVLIATYSQREVYAAEVAAARILSARRARANAR